ncbi:thioredoxin family protein [Paenibacillus soyae]|uniref:Thioredoxin family protein n=1 Tax=Paenibacillus soyae TaxID=2969249 RepID=A0A9X2MSR5_9BACL|nr:thioredoxin family protein [Paenibacillus soyae]MCR2805755.1 thioredoxin family protein [Paenibacillus soyae]
MPSLNIKSLINGGITPESFMETMEVREMRLNGIPDTKRKFREIYQEFTWEHDEDERFFGAFGEQAGVSCHILCTDWCPDVIWNVPILFRVMEKAQVPVEVLIMEENPELMDLFLTNGGRAQPIAVFADRDGNVLGRWGGRPAYIQAVMEEFKRTHTDPQREHMNQIYETIGNLYRAGSSYQTVVVWELKTLFAEFRDHALVSGLLLPQAQ